MWTKILYSLIQKVRISINNQNTTVVSDLAKQIHLTLLQIHITNHDKLLLLGDLARQIVEELAKNYKCSIENI